MFGLYAAGIVARSVSFIANHFFWRENTTPPFMLETADYKLPRVRSVAIGLYTRAMMFLKRAGTTIFSMMVLIWFLASFPRPPRRGGPRIDSSFGAVIGKWLEPDYPRRSVSTGRSMLRYSAWPPRGRGGVGSARSIDQGGKEAAEQMSGACQTNGALPRVGVAGLVHFRAACASTLAVISAETGSWKWMFVTLPTC